MHCKVFGHDFIIARKVTYHVKEYKCKNCKKELTVNGNGNLITLTPKFKEINDVLKYIHQKKKLKLKSNKRLKNNSLLPASR